jgi:hypothetical protein
MPSAAYTLFRHAILAERQVVCSDDGRIRELCPHIIGADKSGEEVVLVWQFAGESSGKLPQRIPPLLFVRRRNSLRRRVRRRSEVSAWDSPCAPRNI